MDESVSARIHTNNSISIVTWTSIMIACETKQMSIELHEQKHRFIKKIIEKKSKTLHKRIIN